MNNFKKVIAKNFILFISLLLCLCGIFFIFVSINEIRNIYHWWSIEELCMVGMWWPAIGIAGISFSAGLIGVIISINRKKRPPKILFYFTFLFLIFLIISLFPLDILLPFNNCDFRASFDSKAEMVCHDVSDDKKEELYTWKKCVHSSGFNFEYPDYLKIAKEEQEKHYWQIRIESPDFSYQSNRYYSEIDSGFELSITVYPKKNMTFKEFKNFVDPRCSCRRSDGVWIEKNSRKFFTKTFEESSKIADSEYIFYNSLNTLYSPNLMISASIKGTKENKEEMEMILNHFIETLK